MATIDSRILFLTTSPRTPEKMIPEIGLLIEHFEGQEWNPKTQTDFMSILRDENFFNGEGAKDPALSARDRITRAPKSLGFVTLKPEIALTSAGKALLTSKRKEEIFLRQMLKFQVPSPYHKPTKKAATFCVKPFLEMLRLVRTMGTLKFDELQIFGMQLTDWHDFDEIVKKIKRFRIVKLKAKGNYRKLKSQYLHKELEKIFLERISSGETKTRESNDTSLTKFLNTQANNMRDYADACFRYLRATGLVKVSHKGKSLSIIPERIADVDFILKTVDRNPCFVNDEKKYVSYLGDATLPMLLTDDRKALLKRLKSEFNEFQVRRGADIEELKNLLYDLSDARKEETIKKQIIDIKNYKLYDEIQDTFNKIKKNELLDAPLMLEWNTWRAMTMLDGGEIKANLKFDDFGNPISTALGNMADIVCDYGDYMLSVEVTMQNAQKQYESEGESVSRHLGKLKKSSEKPCFCLFIAPKINEACVAYFYVLHKTNVSYYGGESIIVPLPLDVFQKMLEDSYNVDYTPSPKQVRHFFEHSRDLAKKCENEIQWFEEIQNAAMNWLQ